MPKILEEMYIWKTISYNIRGEVPLEEIMQNIREECLIFSEIINNPFTFLTIFLRK